MQVRAVDFVAIPVSDTAAGARFYRDVLGLRELFAGEGWAEYDAGNVTLSLVPSGEEGAPTGARSAVALAVADVAAALSELSARGVRVVEGVHEFEPCFMALIEDPFGNRLYLHQRKDGSAG
jgi:predicted enzyme related to lactoylglutathione lyase